MLEVEDGHQGPIGVAAKVELVPSRKVGLFD